MIHIHKKDILHQNHSSPEKKSKIERNPIQNIIENNKSIKLWAIFPFPYSSFIYFFAPFFLNKYKKKKI